MAVVYIRVISWHSLQDTEENNENNTRQSGESVTWLRFEMDINISVTTTPIFSGVDLQTQQNRQFWLCWQYMQNVQNKNTDFKGHQELNTKFLRSWSKSFILNFCNYGSTSHRFQIMLIWKLNSCFPKKVSDTYATITMLKLTRDGNLWVRQTQKTNINKNGLNHTKW